MAAKSHTPHREEGRGSDGAAEAAVQSGESGNITAIIRYDKIRWSWLRSE